MQVEKHLDTRQQAVQLFVKTMITHAKGLYTQNPKYIEASSSTFNDIERFGQLLRQQEFGASAQPPTVSSPVTPPSNGFRLPGQRNIIDMSASSIGTPPAMSTNSRIPRDPDACWWRLKQMEQDQPAAWVHTLCSCPVELPAYLHHLHVSRRSHAAELLPYSFAQQLTSYVHDQCFLCAHACSDPSCIGKLAMVAIAGLQY